MSGFEGAPKLKSVQKEAEYKEVPLFKVGDLVIVERSDGRLEKGWEVDSLGKRIKVINKAQRKGKFVDPEDLQRWTEIGFETNEPVMVKRSNGQIEAGWRVIDFGQGIIEVNKIDENGKPTARKFVTLEELKEWNKR